MESAFNMVLGICGIAVIISVAVLMVTAMIHCVDALLYDLRRKYRWK